MGSRRCGPRDALLTILGPVLEVVSVDVLLLRDLPFLEMIRLCQVGEISAVFVLRVHLCLLFVLSILYQCASVSGCSTLVSDRGDSCNLSKIKKHRGQNFTEITN